FKYTLAWIAAAGAFLLMLELFYSSFFSNNGWPAAVLASFKLWARTGRSDHIHPWLTYIGWLAREETLLLLLGFAAAVPIILRSADRFRLFIALWFFGSLAAYSIVPYKTPWLMLNFIPPLALAGGLAAERAWQWAKSRPRPASVLVLSVMVVI